MDPFDKLRTSGRISGSVVQIRQSCTSVFYQEVRSMAEEGVHAKEFDFEDWLTEGIKGFRGCYKKLSPHLPEEFLQHTQAARREMLLAMRSLIDAAIERAEGKEGKPKKKATKIKVE